MDTFAGIAGIAYNQREVKMIRFLLGSIFVVCTLNLFSFEVTYKDGLRIKSVGWPKKLSNWWKKRKITSE